MKISNKQIIKYGLIFIVIFVIISAGLAYYTQGSDPVTKSFKKLYPAAIVGSKIVSVEEAQQFIRLAGNMDKTASSSTIYQIFLQREQQKELLKKLGLKIESDAISDEKLFYTKGNDAIYSEFIKTYFEGRDELFVQNVVEPEVIESKLRIFYNSDKNLNAQTYAKARDILDQLNAGAKFEDLAKQYSDDKETGQLGGDMGFFEHGQVIPELEKQITILKQGEVNKNIIADRNGLEIVYPLEVSNQDGKKMWHAKHILIQTAGFDDWLSNQLNQIHIKTIKKY